MSQYQYSIVETSAEKKVKSAIALEKMKEKNPDIEPIILRETTLAKNWWGKAWNLNLESYADYKSRIARGKRYVRSNTVLDLKISKGNVHAKVQGSRFKPYEVTIMIEALSIKNADKLLDLCHDKIDSLEQLTEGKFPVELEVLFTEKSFGLFPTPKEIHFSCNCPDGARMCKHVAAVLYGVGVRLDTNPLLFFDLRDLDGQSLVKKTMTQKIESMLKNAGQKSNRELDEGDISKLFGL